MKFESKGNFPKYIPIGGTFMVEGKKYKCIQGNDRCSLNNDPMTICAFHPLEGGTCQQSQFCIPYEREDKNEVIYIPV